MRQYPAARLIGILVLAVSLAYPSMARAQGTPTIATPVTGGVEVVANGLANPRGFTWGDDGTLYLALAGTGGEAPGEFMGTPTPLSGGKTGSIVSVAGGCTTPIVEGLPSTVFHDFGWVFGVYDVVTLNGELYALVGGGGATGGNPDTPNGVYRVTADGAAELVADLGAWFTENPTEFIAPDYNPEGSLFDMESDGEKLWISEAVGGRLVTVTPDGEIALVADLSVDHLVPTGVALDGEGGAYVTFETVVPYPDGGSKVVHVAADGTVTDVWTGLTAVTDLVMSPDGVLYAAEMATNNLEEPPYLNPGTGRIVRQTGPDTLEEVAVDADYPVFLAFADDGSLYATLPAFGEGTGEGQGALVRIDVAQAPVSLAGVADAAPTCATG